LPYLKSVLNRFEPNDEDNVDDDVDIIGRRESDVGSVIRGDVNSSTDNNNNTLCEIIQEKLLLPPSTHLVMTLNLLDKGLCQCVERSLRLGIITKNGALLLTIEVGRVGRKRRRGRGEEYSLGEMIFEEVSFG